MNYVTAFLVIIGISHFFAPSVNAIILIPALILIPIAKIIAVIIAGFSFPVLAISALWAKLMHKPLIKMILISFIILCIATFLFGVCLKIINPTRPFF